MAAGRPPKNVELKKIEGTYRNDRDAGKDKIDFGLVIDAGNAPAWFSEEQKNEYYFLTEILIKNNVLHKTDLNLVLAYCIEAGTYFKYSRYLIENNIKMMNAGKIILVPEVKLVNEALRNMIKISEKLGLSPVDRMRLKNPEKKHNDDDPLIKILGIS